VTPEDLKNFGLLSEFGDEDREALFELLDERPIAEGRRIFSEGTESEGLVLVASGRVRVESRRATEPAVLEAGCALGALSLIALGRRESTIFADTACSVLILPRTAYRRLADDYPRTACRLMEAIMDELTGLVRSGLDLLAL
jgi:CRP-like cAMP-binding protein